MSIVKAKKGFTLIELLVVVAIIGLLATLAIISLGTARSKARDAKRLADIKSVQSALELYNNENAAYPAGGPALVLGGATATKLCSPEGFAAAGACTTVLMAGVPKDPDAANSYTYTLAAPNYKLGFKLEKATGSLAVGDNCATPAGLQPGVCP